jgi:WD40 repeat protein
MSSNFETYLLQQHVHPQDAVEIALVISKHFNSSDLAKLSLEEFNTVTSSLIKGKITQYVTWLACKDYHNNALLSTTSNTTTTTSKKSHFAPYTNITNPSHVIDLGKREYNRFLEEVKFSPDGKFLYVAMCQTMEIWSIPSYQLQFSTAAAAAAEIGGANDFAITDISPSPTGDVLALIVTQYFLQLIVIWNTNTHTTIKKLQKNYQLNHVQYNTTGSALGFCGLDGVGVHDVTNDEFPLLFVIEQRHSGARSVHFFSMINDAREYFVYVTSENIVCINLQRGSTTTNQQLWIYPLHYVSEVAEIDSSVRHGLFIVSPLYFTHLNIANGQIIKQIENANIQPCKVSGCESFIVIGGYDGSIEVWNIPEMTVVNRWDHSKLNDEAVCVCVHPSGNSIASYFEVSTNDNQIKFWNE